ncbi:hypothetical protein LTR85_001419 [Meristemomyces frigidus]|nr:hypothetical protein LTR85_001419 [Meristemomyces frigidus]
MSFDALIRSATVSVKPVVLSAESINRQAIESFPDTSHGHVTWRTLVSSSRTGSNELTVGLATCPSGSGSLHHHRHTQAEIYHVTGGSGIVTIDGEESAVEKGAVVYIPGNAEHSIRCMSDTEDLEWLYCFAADDFGEIRYRFS